MNNNTMYLNLGLHMGFEAQGKKFSPEIFKRNCGNLIGNCGFNNDFLWIWGYPIRSSDLTYLQFELDEYLGKCGLELSRIKDGVKLTWIK